MPKISQSEYIKTISMKVRARLEHVLYDNMINELNMLVNNLDTKRVIERLIDESIYQFNNELSVYIEETGVPRKKRENKGSDNAFEKKTNAYVDFCKKHRSSVASKMKLTNNNITLKASDVTKRLSEMWNELNHSNHNHSKNREENYEKDEDIEED